ncbi:MAG: flagellar hook-basal body protein [Candidatus Riflebacteria bacterium]|nr:flagellar hook-basal body protein [Candidatus Riflebacteria bacterium]
MIRGLYTATSGMLCETIRQDMIADNLANVDTAGFKRMVGIFKELPTMDVKRVNDGKLYPPRPHELYPKIGNLGTGVIVDESVTDFTAGRFEHTEDEFDCALENPKAFFLVQTPHGIRFTRDGNFTLDQEGYLKNMNGDYLLAEPEPPEAENQTLLGEDGKPTFQFFRIKTEPGDRISFDDDGRVVINDAPQFKLLRGMATDRKAFRKEGSNLFDRAYGDVKRASGEVKHGYLEKPNFSVVEEMVKMIEVQRSYEANSKVIQAHDSMLDKAINTVGRPRGG